MLAAQVPPAAGPIGKQVVPTHGAQLAPRVPHAAPSVPARHAAPEQQPAQLSGPHVVAATHPPSAQAEPRGQATHAAPPLPHSRTPASSSHVFP